MDNYNIDDERVINNDYDDTLTQLRKSDLADEPVNEYVLPDYKELLAPLPSRNNSFNSEMAKQDGETLIRVLKGFNMPCELDDIKEGPVTTSFFIKPLSKFNVSNIDNIKQNLQMELGARKMLYEVAPDGYPGIAIQIPTADRNDVYMIEVLEELENKHPDNSLMIPIGKDAYGNMIFEDITKMNNLLVGGTTGSGKSMFLNSIISTLLIRNKPEDIKLVLIDPIIVEFNLYSGVPHLETPVVHGSVDKAFRHLDEIIEERFSLFSEFKVRNIDEYNELLKNDRQLRKLYPIVLFIDEVNDVMGDNERLLSRIVREGNQVGIYSVLASQSPSTDVVIPVIRSNMNSRLTFEVAMEEDSKIAIDSAGAEELVGQGDMIYVSRRDKDPRRIQGAFISNEEIHRISKYVSNQQQAKFSRRVEEIFEYKSIKEEENA